MGRDYDQLMNRELSNDEIRWAFQPLVLELISISPNVGTKVDGMKSI